MSTVGPIYCDPPKQVSCAAIQHHPILSNDTDEVPVIRLTEFDPFSPLSERLSPIHIMIKLQLFSLPVLGLAHGTLNWSGYICANTRYSKSHYYLDSGEILSDMCEKPRKFGTITPARHCSLLFPDGGLRFCFSSILFGPLEANRL